MNHARWALAIVLGLGLVPTLTRGGDEGDDAAASRLINDCGVNSLYLMLKLRSAEVGLAEVRRSLPSAEAHGLSILEIQEAASKHGLTLRGRRIKPEELPIDRPMIVLLKHPTANPGHFVVLEPVGVIGKKVMVLDFPRPPRVVEYKELSEGDDWTGLALAPVTRWERIAPWVASIAGVSLVVAGFVYPRKRSRPTNADAE